MHPMETLPLAGLYLLALGTLLGWLGVALTGSVTSSYVLFGNLQKIMRAQIGDLTEVEGVGDARARAIKEGLSRLAETSILERYV